MKAIGLLLAAIMVTSSARADTTWDELQHLLYDGQSLLPAAELITIEAPYRTADDARTQIAARVAAPAGVDLVEVALILDENPMPVSAVFRFDQPQPRFGFDATMRINGPTAVHVVAETTDGRLFVADSFVKTSGQGACSAPPGTDRTEALATLGQMSLTLRQAELGGGSLSDRLAALADLPERLDIDIRHPSHSGMQMDQISLLFIPMRYVETLDIAIDGAPFARVTGSISLSENPDVSLTVPPGSHHAKVALTDTDGTTSTAETNLSGY